MNKKLINQVGSSMIEMLGVLSVAGMLGYGVLKIIGTGHEFFIRNMVVSEARDLQKKISERYSFEGVYDTTLFSGRTCTGQDTVAAYICAQKLAPDQMCSNGKLHHRGGGDVKICQSDDNDKYAMIFYGLSKTTCALLVQTDWHTRKKSYIYFMVVNGNDGTKIYSNYIAGNHGDNVFPVSEAKAMTICDDEDDNNTVQMTFF